MLPGKYLLFDTGVKILPGTYLLLDTGVKILPGTYLLFDTGVKITFRHIFYLIPVSK